MELISLALVALSLLVLTVLLGVALLRSRSKVALVDQQAKELTSLRDELKAAQTRVSAADGEKIRLQERLDGVEKAAATAAQQAKESLDALKVLADDLTRRLEAEQTISRTLTIKVATAAAEVEGAKEELRRYKETEAQRNVSLKAEIENLTQKIFDEKTGKFKELGTAAIAELVKPIGENLAKLQKALVDSETADQVREQRLVSSLENLNKLNTQLGVQAEGLAKALQGNNKTMGDFGEVLLERLLEFSGLTKDVHYIEQGEDLKLRSEDGGHLKPDLLILLPENRCLVVDSKMSLKSWVAAQTDEEVARLAALTDFRSSIRKHVTNLASKPYTEAVQKSGRITVDFKLLFVPIEAAFHASLENDRALYQDAFNQRVILVSPTTLLAVLSTVELTWKQFDLSRNARLISDRASLLLDKLMDFLGSMDKIGDQLERTQKVYEEAKGRLISGKGSLVIQATKLQKLGVKSDKALPADFAALVSDSDEADS